MKIECGYPGCTRKFANKCGASRHRKKSHPDIKMKKGRPPAKTTEKERRQLAYRAKHPAWVATPCKSCGVPLPKGRGKESVLRHMRQSGWACELPEFVAKAEVFLEEDRLRSQRYRDLQHEKQVVRDAADCVLHGLEPTTVNLAYTKSHRANPLATEISYANA